MKVTVLIPTYRRVEALANCLRGLAEQTRLPDEVLLIVRETDRETLAFLKEHRQDELPLHVVFVPIPGQVAALNRGLETSSGDIVAITDDDTIPKGNWLETIVGHFQRDPKAGGVGGRDWVFDGERFLTDNRRTVGKISWYGRIVGNHHLGAGSWREVDVLKGANMAYRASALKGLRFNGNLKGDGAQVHNDLAFSLSVKQAGWKLIYDPQVAVDHYPAKRQDADQRNRYNATAVYNAVYNETTILKHYLPIVSKPLFFAWAFLIGTSSAPGILQWARLFARRRAHATDKFVTTMRGRLHAIRYTSK